MLSRSIAVSTLLLAGVTAAAFAQLHTFTDPDGNFSVSVPGSMTKTQSDSGTPGNPWIAFIAQDGGVNYVVQYKAVSDNSTDGNLDWLRNWLVGQSGARVTDERSVRLNGTYPGKILSVENTAGGVSGVTAFFIANNRVYMVAAMRSSGSGSEADDFVSSFRILN
jgi:hypothetical protein